MFKKIFGKSTPQQDEQVKNAINKVKSGVYNKIFPILKPGDWVGLKAGAHHDILIGSEENLEIVIAYGYDTPENFIFLTNKDCTEKYNQDGDKIWDEAYGNLENSFIEWEYYKELDGFLEDVKADSILILDDHDFSAEMVLSKKAMTNAHELLKSKEIYVSSPRRGYAIATSKNAPQNVINVFVDIHKRESNSDVSAFITKKIFVVSDCEIESIASV